MLADINSLPFIEEQIELAGIDAECICFVVTETAVVDSFITAKRMIDALRQLGCRFALADFGTGLSSFAYLKHFKVDTIKIAGEFIRNVCHDRIDQAMVNTVRTAASDLGIMTIAENVESKAAYELLQDMGVDYLQGDYVSEPVVLIEPVKH
jgi:EAL domain-containing protein (putative c-di-GMP-specific phosphodiesterase class I)